MIMITKTLKLTFPAMWKESINKINAIKAIRMLTGLGLKEAKDIADQGGQASIRTAVTEGVVAWGDGSVVPAKVRFDIALRELKGAGVEVVEQGREFLADIRRLTAEAVLAGEDEVAMALLDVLKRFKI